MLTLSNHALNEILSVVEYNSVPFGSILLALHRLDLYTLNDRVDHVLAGKDLAQAANGDCR